MNRTSFSFVLISLFTFVHIHLTLASNPPINSPSLNPCDDLNTLHQQALNYFIDGRGEKKQKESLFGTTYYYDYKLNLWEAKHIELTEAVDLGGNQLIYTYIETKDLEEAKKTYQRILNQFNECKPDGYVRLDKNSDTYVQQDYFIDQRDKDSWGFYDWPEYEITLYNNAGTYQVSMRILSKKFD